MKLNHLNLSVPDIASARSFFETYLDFTCTDSKLNDSLSVLTGEDGFILVLMSQQMNRNGNNAYPDSFHIGFYLKNEAEVLAKFEQLASAGFILEHEPQRIRKVFGFYYLHQNILIEIVCELQDPNE
ncbi:VOC family protein [Chryseobacterium paludis]|uniref:VOC family protein n=1 Tax=Chryseobacterium paludis TaxID=2956784 RepID=UPI0021BE7909|nr:VOC family protein [Chryseobacterium paludis]